WSVIGDGEPRRRGEAVARRPAPVSGPLRVPRHSLAPPVAERWHLSQGALPGDGARRPPDLLRHRLVVCGAEQRQFLLRPPAPAPGPAGVRGDLPPRPLRRHRAARAPETLGDRFVVVGAQERDRVRGPLPTRPAPRRLQCQRLRPLRLGGAFLVGPLSRLDRFSTLLGGGADLPLAPFGGGAAADAEGLAPVPDGRGRGAEVVLEREGALGPDRPDQLG